MGHIPVSERWTNTAIIHGGLIFGGKCGRHRSFVKDGRGEITDGHPFEITERTSFYLVLYVFKDIFGGGSRTQPITDMHDWDLNPGCLIIQISSETRD